MKIAFMGTPDFAVPTLEKLYQAGHQVDLVITQPDAMRDRGKKVKFTPVKEVALSKGAKVLQPDKVKNNPELVKELTEYGPDLIVVVAYGRIIPKEILDLPPMGCINVHGSILPRFRGAAPIQRAVLEGEEETGVTIMYMGEGMDTGDMLSIAKTPIGSKTTGQLFDELAILGGDLLVNTLEGLKEGKIKPVAQDHTKATYAPMVFKKDGQIDFTLPAAYIERQIRAMDPWPGAYTSYQGEPLKIWQAKVEDGQAKEEPGTIVAADNEGIKISTGQGYLLGQVIQLPGKKRISVKDYLRGNRIELFYVLR